MKMFVLNTSSMGHMACVKGQITQKDITQ